MIKIISKATYEYLVEENERLEKKVLDDARRFKREKDDLIEDKNKQSKEIINQRIKIDNLENEIIIISEENTCLKNDQKEKIEEKKSLITVKKNLEAELKVLKETKKKEELEKIEECNSLKSSLKLKDKELESTKAALKETKEELRKANSRSGGQTAQINRLTKELEESNKKIENYKEDAKKNHTPQSAKEYDLRIKKLRRKK